MKQKKIIVNHRCIETMYLPFEDAEIRAKNFVASLYTISELMKSIEDYRFTKNMISTTKNISALKPSVGDFEKELMELNEFHIKCANSFQEHMGVSA
ncbi:MAG: hypothetical protein H8E12_09035 [Rhodobacteraceae bacterium]|nr:hypothetical protein [Paracoccaceae bacterium]